MGEVDKNGIRIIPGEIRGPKPTNKLAKPDPRFRRTERYTPFLHKLLHEREGGRCWYCGRILPLTIATVDHVIPRFLDGDTSLANCVLCCHPCNRAKANMTLQMFRMQRADKYYRFFGELEDRPKERKVFDDSHEASYQAYQEAKHKRVKKVQGEP